LAAVIFLRGFMKSSVFLFTAVSLLLMFKFESSQAQGAPVSKLPAPVPASSPIPPSLNPGLANSPAPTMLDFGQSQPTPGANASSPTLPAPSGECYIPLGLFGVRISTELAFFNLTDFNSNQDYLNFHYAQLAAGNPVDQYRFHGSGPDDAVVFEVAPFYPLTTNWEVGLNFDYWAFTPFVFDASDIHPQYFHDWQRNLSSVELNVFSRFYFLKTSNGANGLFLEGGAGIQPMTAQLSQNEQNTGNTPSTDQTGDMGNATAFDASAKVGAAMDLGAGFSLGVKGGYQYSYATGFTGTYSDAVVSSRNGVRGELMMFTDPNSGLNVINFVPSDSANYANFGITPAQVAAARKLVMDLSGLRLSMDLTCHF
jgi:hypothetical protein